jgi:uncharacterized protein HemX
MKTVLAIVPMLILGALGYGALQNQVDRNAQDVDTNTKALVLHNAALAGVQMSLQDQRNRLERIEVKLDRLVEQKR